MSVSQLQSSKPSSSSVWHSKSLSFHSLEFRVVVNGLTFRVTSTVWHLEPSSLLSYDVQSCLSQFDIQRYQFLVMAFKAFIFFNLAFKTASPARRSESPSFLSLGVQSHHVFLQLGVLSHHLFLVQHSESLSLYSLTFKAFIFFSLAFITPISSQFGLQSHVFSLAFRVTSPVWRSKPPSLFSLAFKATISSQFGRSEPPPLLSLGVQSHHLFSVWAFRATISFQFSIQSHCPFTIGCSKPSSYHDRAFIATFSIYRVTIPSQFGVQRHHSITIGHSLPPFRHSEPHSQHLELSFSFSSMFKTALLAFRVAIFFQFSIQSHSYHSKPLSSVLSVQSHVFNLAFRAVILFNLAFRTVVRTHYDILSHFLSFGVQSRSSLALSFRIIAPNIHIHWHCISFTILHSSSFSSSRYLVLIGSSSCSYRLPLPLHMTQSFKFTTHTSLMLFSTLHLAFSCNSHRVILFGCILLCTPWQFDHYSSLTLILEHFGRHFRGILNPQCSFKRHSKSYHSLRILEPLLFLCWFERVCVILVYLQGSFFSFERVHFIPLTIHTFLSLQCSCSLHS